MTNESVDSKKKTKKSANFFLWWQVDPAELDKQVAQYATLGSWIAARSVSALLLLFSAALSGVLGYFGWLGFDAWALIDAALMLVLAALVLKGQRWAIIAAMTFWTASKYISIYSMVVGGGGNGFAVVTQLIWWCIYMQQFNLALRVENRRRDKRVPTAT